MPDGLHEHRLEGCTPKPLVAYLKALAVLRLISTAASNVKGVAADPGAKGWWQGERFHLGTALDVEQLLAFFQNDYAPSPIIAPWNGRAGFLEGEDGEEATRTGARLVSLLEGSEAERLRHLRETIVALRRDPILARYDQMRAEAKAAKKAKDTDRHKALEKEAKALKSQVIPALRAATDPRHLDFVDACFVLSADERAAPLLGSGGNDGSRDFGVNFAEQLAALFDFETGAARPGCRRDLLAALLAVSTQGAGTGAMGQFSPGQGGANATSGFEGYNALNPWDVLLALEGTLLFAGTLTRRWGASDTGRAAFPFTFEPSRAGSGAFSPEDPNAPRGEVWVPLWSRPCRLSEVTALFAEGRLTLGRSTARTGLDAARAVASLGISRGIDSFERFSIIQPDSKMPYQATPVGRFHAPDRASRDLVADLEAGGWLSRIGRLARGGTAPSRARIAVHRLEDALFDLAQPDRAADGARASLMALGEVVDWLATSRNGREQADPPPPLSSAWISMADDGSAEFRIAAALAWLGFPLPGGESESAVREAALEQAAGDVADPTIKLVPRLHALPMAAHIAPLDPSTVRRRRRRWTEVRSPSVVWAGADLVPNLIAVLERRQIEQLQNGPSPHTFAAPWQASMRDIATFLEGPPGFDDRRCAALLRGMVWTRPGRPGRGAKAAILPLAFAIVKPLLAPADLLVDLRYLPRDRSSAAPPGLVGLLRRGAVDEAVRAALARARGAGMASPFDPARSRSGAVRFGSVEDGGRLAAALLIPIDKAGLLQLLDRAYTKLHAMEDNDDAA